MGSLSNLYISRSYQSLIHLGTDNTASADLIQLQDGLGNNLGVSFNTEGDISASGDLTTNTLRVELDTEITGGVDINTHFTASTPAYENLFDPYYTHVVRVTGSYEPEGGIPPTINDVKVGWICNGINVTNGIVTDVSGSGTGDVWVTIDGEYPQINQSYTFTGEVVIPVRITGSLDVTNDITASNLQLRGDLVVSGTIYSDRVVTTTISSSVIYSSGSNIFGDDVSDTQTIVGQTTISGSLTSDGPFVHRGSVDITGSLKVSNDISSSTVSGIGNVELYSASVDSRLDYLEGPFSTSVDERLDYLEGPFSTSVDHRLDLIEDYTASLKTAFTASGVDVAFNGNISVVGSISAYEIHTIIESASVIFSSGSNVLGDEVSDTQTLNGTVNIPNTLFVAGVEFIPFSSSVDFRLVELENWSSSLQADFVTEEELAAATGALEVSIAKKLDSASFQSYTESFETSFNAYTSSTDILIATKLDSASFQTWTSSVFEPYTSSVSSSFGDVITSVNQRVFTSSFEAYTSSQDSKNTAVGVYTSSNDTKWDTIGLLTGSYATTGSNVFNGNNTFNGRVNGNSVSMSVSNSTASIDCSLGNFFYLTVPTGSTQLEASNIIAGQTITLKIKQPSAGYGNVSVFGNTIKFPLYAEPTLTNLVNAEDVLTFVSFDNNSLYSVISNNFI